MSDIYENKPITASVSFRAKARIISEIGDELISSDAIALYELIKNSYDAGSSSVLVSITTPVAKTVFVDFLKSTKKIWDNINIRLYRE